MPADTTRSPRLHDADAHVMPAGSMQVVRLRALALSGIAMLVIAVVLVHED